MNAIFVTGVSGLLFFLGIYLSFDYWYEKIWVKMLGTRDEIIKVTSDMFMQKTPERILNEQIAVSGVFAAIAFFLAWPSIGVGLVGALLLFWATWRLPLFYYKQIVFPARVKRFTSQLIDGLTLMANGMKSGLNVPQALQIVVDEMPAPIREEFGLILNENKVGLSLDKAFDNLAKRIPTEDVNMFVVSTNILRETGGNVAETFETIVKTIRERLKLQNKISAMVSQGMTSAFIVGGMPFFIAGMLFSIDPDFMRPMFTHPLGLLIWLGVLFLEGLGFFVIMKIVNIKV
jgi:tight adherence protein B